MNIKRVLATSVVAIGLMAPGTALAGHEQGPNCHGKNQVPCRADPQPTHGNDCGTNANVPLNSNDHCLIIEIPL